MLRVKGHRFYTVDLRNYLPKVFYSFLAYDRNPNARVDQPETRQQKLCPLIKPHFIGVLSGLLGFSLAANMKRIMGRIMASTIVGITLLNKEYSKM